MKIRFHARYNTIALYVLIVFVICLLLLMLAFRIDIVSSAFSRIIRVSSPVIWGLVIAYLLNPLMKRTERLLDQLLNQNGRHARLVRGLSVFASILLLLLVLGGLIAAIIPEMIRNIEAIGEMFQDPAFFTEIEWSIHSFFLSLTEKAASAGDGRPIDFDSTESMLLHLLNRVSASLTALFSTDGFLTGITNGLMHVFSSLKNAFLGVILSAYLLCSKERFLAQARKLVCALCPETQSKRLFHFLSGVNRKFICYFTGVALDCLLIGVITFLFMSVTDMPYAILISVLLALTNAIPIFGPFIGSAPAALLIFLFSPGKALMFLIFVIILQQIDGNLIAPRILGDQLGLSGFWIMSAVIIGGGLFGFTGMLLAAPLFAVLYSLLSSYVTVRLEERCLPTETKAYAAGPDTAIIEEPPAAPDGSV